MARQFKPVRFFVLMALTASLVCGVTAFYTHRAARGHTSEERSAYFLGEKAGEEVPAGSQLPTAADLNEMAQKRFKTEGAGEPVAWKGAFETGYIDGFNKTHEP